MSQFGEINEVAKDPAGLYFSVPPAAEWNTNKDAAYFHYTSADTRQGLEIRDFEFDAIPEGMPIVCDASANLGSFNMDISKHDVIYSASHKNFSCSGICYAIIRKSLITRKNQMKAMPTMCNWVKFQEAPNKIYNVPVLTAVWLGAMVCEWMIEKGGVPYFEVSASEERSDDSTDSFAVSYSSLRSSLSLSHRRISPSGARISCMTALTPQMASTARLSPT